MINGSTCVDEETEAPNDALEAVDDVEDLDVGDGGYTRGRADTTTTATC